MNQRQHLENLNEKNLTYSSLNLFCLLITIFSNTQYNKFVRMLACVGAAAFPTVALVADEGFPSETQRQSIFSNLALQYDGIVRWTEISSGINRWRKKLLANAYGDVLELGVGTGRNLKFYRGDKVLQVTGVDFSRSMLEVTDKKKKTLNEKIKLRLVCLDAKTLTTKFVEKSFDCVVDTFGLCSFEDPAAVLRQARLILKDEGRLLLLEHGQAEYEFMNKYLRKHLRHHVEKFGCYHDRPIRKIVEEAGFEILEERKKHFGSISLLVCKKTEALLCGVF